MAEFPEESMQIHRLGRDISVLSDHIPAPGIGFVPVNAFVLHAAEPVVVDTGMPDRDFMNILGSVVDPQDVRWIWLTHPDRDHTGALFDLLEAAPRARLVATFLSMGAMSMERPIPMDRLYLLNPGQSIDVGDRTLTAFRPPLFDNPGTIGLFDDSSRACFTSDCFGAPLTSPELALSSNVGDVPLDELRARQLLWATVDSPWIHTVDPAKYLATIDPLRNMDPALILGICLRLLGAPRTSFPCSRQHRRPIHSSGPIRKHSSKCSPNSNRPPLRPP
jgi:glyoxylase-like metal-dependent hydrolase (beta-lactamase superfamily II)